VHVQEEPREREPEVHIEKEPEPQRHVQEKQREPEPEVHIEKEPEPQRHVQEKQREPEPEVHIEKVKEPEPQIHVQEKQREPEPEVHIEKVKEPEPQVHIQEKQREAEPEVHIKKVKAPEPEVHIKKEPEIVIPPKPVVKTVEQTKPKQPEPIPQSPPKQSPAKKSIEPELVISQEQYEGPFSFNSVLPSSDIPYDKAYKVIVIGESGVGKTNLLGRWSRNQYVPSSPTISVTLVEKTFKVEDKIIRIVIWDTAGQETFRSLTRSYYRATHGAILVFDLSNAASFFNVEKWLMDLRDNSENAQILLVGNKSDLPHRQVTQEDALSLAKKYSLSYMETSAKSGDNVYKAFQSLLMDIHRINGTEEDKPVESQGMSGSGSATIILTAPEKPSKENPKAEKKEGCCS